MTRVLFVVSEAGCAGVGCTTPVTALGDAGFDVTVSTPTGSAPQFDEPVLEGDDSLTATVREIRRTDARLSNPIPLGSVRGGEFDAVVFPGGLGALWDLNQDRAARSLLRDTVAGEEGVALVCGYAADLLAFTRSNGAPIVRGRTVTGAPGQLVTDRLDDASRLPDGRKLPYRIADEVLAAGGHWVTDPAAPNCVRVDGDLVTARGPESAGTAVDALLEALALSLPAGAGCTRNPQAD